VTGLVNILKFIAIEENFYKALVLKKAVLGVSGDTNTLAVD